jgi:hypothetical protein
MNGGAPYQHTREIEHSRDVFMFTCPDLFSAQTERHRNVVDDVAATWKTDKKSTNDTRKMNQRWTTRVAREADVSRGRQTTRIW